MAPAKPKKQSSTKTKVAVSTLALTAAAAGYYFYGSKNAKKHREATSAWAKGLKKEVVEKAKLAKNVTPAMIQTIANEAAKIYQHEKNVKVEDLKNAVKELKSNWERVAEEAQKTKKAAKKTVKVAKKAAKKTIAKKKK